MRARTILATFLLALSAFGTFHQAPAFRTPVQRWVDLSNGKPAARSDLQRRRWVCLKNDSRRPQEDERFCLPHSRFEGRFVPVNEQMTFQAEMEALDALDEAESKLALQADEEDKFDEKGDVTFGLLYRGSIGWSKKSVEARQRWNDPVYRKKVIRKREARLDEEENMEAKEGAREPDSTSPQRQLPQLHDLLRSDSVALSPDSGGWVGKEGSSDETLGRARELGSASILRRDQGSHAGSKTVVSRTNGGSGSLESEGMQRKIKNLKLLHEDQNEWIARRLGKDGGAQASAARGSLAWRLEKQARYKAAALKRVARQRAQSQSSVVEVELDGGSQHRSGRGGGKQARKDL